MDIIVTTPKSQMPNAAREAADCIAAGGGEYFRRLPFHLHPYYLQPGDRVYYIEDGYIRGFALVCRIERRTQPTRCQTTGRLWPEGVYVFMRADSWQWIKPMPMRGFRGYRYDLFGEWTQVKIVGGWLDPKPEVSR